MTISDKISLLALIISLVSFWLSYRAERLTKMITAAEKRSQTHSILVGVLLETEELLYLLRAGTNYDGASVTIPSWLCELERQLILMTEIIPERLNWLREENSQDPVLLEEYKTYSLEVEMRVKKVAPIIRELRFNVKGYNET